MSATEKQCRGAILDLDGVITQTARIHFRAWKDTFDDFLVKRAEKEGIDFLPFKMEDYLKTVDGKPRYQGVRSFLESRDIALPYGEPTDSPEEESICGIGNRKNEQFRAIIARDGAEVFDSTVRFMKELKAEGVRLGVASSSNNCRYILETSGLIDLFETVVGGIVSKELGLKGKPEPDIFLVAAENIGVAASRCLMVEDALSGVEAGRNGNFGLVVGVDRHDNGAALRTHGADIVVSDLKELSVEDVRSWFSTGIVEDAWQLRYEEFEPGEEKLRESLTTVGNGHFGTRGCFEMERADEAIHYPGTYIAGLYNELPSSVFRKTVYNNDLVNCPNWLLVELRIGDGEFVHPLNEEILSYRHTLNMKDALMSRDITFQDSRGRITALHSERIASMADPHLGALRITVTPQNYSERITLRSTLDGTVINYGVERYRELNSKHLYPISVTRENGGISLHVRTTTSKVNVCMHARNRLYQGKRKLEGTRRIEKDMGVISENISFEAREKTSYTLEKVVSIYTSLEQGLKDDPEEVAKCAISRNHRFDFLLEAHRKAWHRLWNIADYRVQGDRYAQKAIHLHIYHLLVTGSIHNTAIDWGMPARGLHGEAYRGHIFWDEVYIFPFYNLHLPQVARSFLMYRYRRLDAARAYAAENGYEGAMYPWQSADSGKEETQTLHFNPMSGKWGPDLSRLQRHVSLAIAYNIWEYFYITGDLEFLHRYGVEMMVEITRFWASAAKFSKRDKRYHIAGVMGPDEFHEKDPEAKKGGLRDNAYTNIMTCWLMHKTIETIEHLPKTVIKNLEEKIGFSMDETAQWRDIVQKMSVVITEEGIISQFDGYMDLQELDWDRYHKRYGNIRRLDRILKSEGDSPDRYKVSKQADTLMIFYLLSPGQVKHILELMGYDVNDEIKLLEKNYEYYSKRTSHGSTLSSVVHAAVLGYLRRSRRAMWEFFRYALESDIDDVQGGTTSEAVHTGVMAGTLDLIFKGFAGVNIFRDHLEMEPCLPSHWTKISFKILLWGNLYAFEITRDRVRGRQIKGTAKELEIRVNGSSHKLKGKSWVSLEYGGCGG
jgi:beta-phosphoglucomutase family hydrolase